MGLIGPWTPPAKNARWDLEVVGGGGETSFEGMFPLWRFISGRLTSFCGSNPSDEFALHRTRIEFV